jgi:hypothetical protein
MQLTSIKPICLVQSALLFQQLIPVQYELTMCASSVLTSVTKQICNIKIDVFSVKIVDNCWYLRSSCWYMITLPICSHTEKNNQDMSKQHGGRWMYASFRLEKLHVLTWKVSMFV